MAKKKGPITSLSPLHEANAQKNKPKKAPRQPDLPGIPNTKRVPELEAVFEDYDEVKAARLVKFNLEKQKYEEVITAMKAAKVSAYKFSSRDGTTVTIKLKGKESFTVHKAKPDAFKEDGEE